MVMLFLAGCQAEEVVIENHEHGHGISIVRKKFKDFDKLPSLTKEILKQQDLAYRGGTNDPLYDFTIDSSAVTQAIKDGKTHYTMPIMRENSSDESFENLVITDDGVEKEAFLIKYFPSNEYYERLKTNIHAPYIGGMNLQKIDLDNLQQRGTFNTVCVTYTQAYCNWSKDGNGPVHIAGPGCTQIIGSNTWEECFSFTVLDPEPEKFVNIDPGSNSGGGPSGGNSNPNNPNPTQPNPSNPQDPNLTNPADGTIISEPVIPESTRFFRNLFQVQKDYLNSHASVRTEIDRFINSGGDWEFTKSAIDALIEGGEVDFALQVIIDPSFSNNSILMNVYNLFGGMPTFKNYLQNFEGSFSVAHLKLAATSSLPNNVNAQTSTPENYVVTITFNTNNLNRPDLSIARTMIHEIIHAEIYRKMLVCAGLPHVNFENYTNQQWVSYITNLQNNFPGIYDYYIRWAVQNQNPSAQQHELMAQHYRNIIIQALKEYDNSQPEQLYQALAWVGLKGTAAWNSLSQAQRDSIDLTIANFEN